MSQAVIDKLGEVLLRAKGKRDLIVVVGDGIDPVADIIAPEKLFEEHAAAHGSPPTKDEEPGVLWPYYEFARFQTRNQVPALGYFVLHYLATIGCIRSIVTTNYDLYFDSIAARYPRSLTINPICAKGEHSWEGYYRPTRDLGVPVWKIHGSLSHVRFLGCPPTNPRHRFALPSLPVSNDIAAIRKRWHLKAVHNHLDAPCEPGGEAGSACHYLDWYPVGRDAFAREIFGAMASLCSPNLGGLLLLGFTGFFDASAQNDWNEELAPIIQALSKNVPTFHLLNKAQSARAAKHPPSALFHSLDSSRRVVFDESGEVLGHAVEAAGLRTKASLEAEWHWNWVSGNQFMTAEMLFEA